jgi:hypothetical protein
VLIPQTAVELQLQLGLLAVAKLLDGRLFEGREARGAECGVVGEDRAQHREGNRHDHAIDVHVGRALGGLKYQRVRVVRVVHDAGQPVVQLHRARAQSSRDSPRQPLVAANDVKTLVRAAEDGELSDVEQQIHDVQRALLGGHVPVLDVVGGCRGLSRLLCARAR